MSTPMSPHLVDVLRAAIDSFRAELHTALPGRIEKYEKDEQRADVKPLLNRTIVSPERAEITEQLPIVQGVPVIFPRAGSFFISFPVQKGDHVLLVFTEASLDQFIGGSGHVTDPVDLRRHDLSDAVALPGLYPFAHGLGPADVNEAALVIGKEGGARIFVGDDDINLYEQAAAERVALGQKTDDRIQQIEQFLTSFYAEFAAHQHTHIAPLIPASPTPTVPPLVPPATGAPPAGSSVQAAKVKAT